MVAILLEKCLSSLDQLIILTIFAENGILHFSRYHVNSDVSKLEFPWLKLMKNIQIF